MQKSNSKTCTTCVFESQYKSVLQIYRKKKKSKDNKKSVHCVWRQKTMRQLFLKNGKNNYHLFLQWSALTSVWE